MKGLQLPWFHAGTTDGRYSAGVGQMSCLPPVYAHAFKSIFVVVLF